MHAGPGARREGAFQRTGRCPARRDPAFRLLPPGRRRRRRARRTRARLGSWCMDQKWGAETTKAVENFKISGEPVPAPVVHWLGRIKGAAARGHAELGLLDSDLAERIARAG